MGASATNPAVPLSDLGDLDDARAHYERALSIDEAAYGPDHPQTEKESQPPDTNLKARVTAHISGHHALRQPESGRHADLDDPKRSVA